MSRVLFDHACESCGHVFEELVRVADPVTVPCEKCGQPATRQLAAPRIDPRLGVSTHFPTMADRWARVRRQRQKHAEKLHRANGDIR